MAVNLTPSESEILFRLLLSAILGLAIGLEREMHDKPAGMRTIALVGMGSTLFTVLSLNFINNTSIASGIVTGIGFLGAGSIFHARNKVSGLTTAAELWIIAAIGMAVGIGEYLLAIASVAIILSVVIGGFVLENKYKMPKALKIRKKPGYE